MMKLLEKKKSYWLVGIVVALIFLVVIGAININMISTRISNLGSKNNENTKAYKVFSEADKKTQSPNVEFLAYFNNGGELVDCVDATIGNGKNLYMSLNVMNEGYLENGVISIDSNDFYWNTQISSSNSFVDNSYSGVTSKVKLSSKVESGNQTVFSGKIEKNLETTNKNSMKSTGNVTFTGTYVGYDGSRVDISKTVSLKVNWNGTVNAEMQSGTEIVNPVINGDTVDVGFYISSLESKKQLLLKSNVVTAEIPTLNEYSPLSVKVTSSCNGYSYNSSDRTLTITNSSSIDKNGDVLKRLSSINNYDIVISYPKEAIDINNTGILDLSITTTGKYCAYGSNEDINSNTAVGYIRLYYNSDKSRTEEMEVISKPSESIPDGTSSSYKDNKIEHSYSMYVGQERLWESDGIIPKGYSRAAYSSSILQNTNYAVEWQLNTGNKDNINKVVMKEPEKNYGDNFIISKDKMISMNDMVSIKRIYIKAKGLGDSKTKARMNIFNDETNEIIETQYLGNKYSTEYEISLKDNIKHIRVEITDLAQNGIVIIGMVKEIDNRKLAEKIDKETFDSIKYIDTYMEETTNLNTTGKEQISYSRRADFEDKKANLDVKLSEKSFERKDSYKKINEEISIKTYITGPNQCEWKNGIFLVEIPECILNVDINNVYFNGDYFKSKISGYEKYENEGKTYIKIYTKNDEPEAYEIKINVDLELNPLAKEGQYKFKVYGYNEDCYNYVYKAKDVYDINNNGIYEEEIGYDYVSSRYVASKGVYTVQTASNYDDKGSICIAPNITEVDRKQGKADINVQFVNDYENKLTKVKLLGVIPCTNNTHIVTNESLNSEFDTVITDEGIRIPDELKKYVTVYYSDNINATADVNDSGNGWITNPKDWSSVKKFLIDFENYSIKTGASYTFNYTVQIPSEIDYNKKSYSAFALYYSVNTEDGITNEYSEPSKLGLDIIRKYKLDLTKFNFENNKKVSNATYLLIGKDGDEISNRYLTTNNDGKIIHDANVGVEYTLKEYLTKDEYCLNDDEIKFVVNEDEAENLNIEILSEDNFRIEPKIENNVFIGELENEPRFKLNLLVKDSITGERIAYAPFHINEEIFSTNINGEAKYGYLDKDIKYTLCEDEPVGYYAIDDVDFSIQYTGKGEYEVISEYEALKNAIFHIDENEDAINVDVEILNERKPSILVHKVDALTNEPLKTVTFLNETNGRYYFTDDNGNFVLDSIDEEKEISLKEISATGYYLEDIKFTVSKDESGNLVVSSDNNDFNNATIYDKDKKILKVTLKNTPIAKYNLEIEKIGKDTQRKLENYEFSLFSKDDDEMFSFKSNENGDIVIPDLYAYVEGRKYIGEYILKETKAPDGYANNAEEIKFKVKQNENGDLEIEISNIDSLETLKSFSVDGNTIKFVIEDKPMFTLIKKDSETGENIANAKFIIYQIDENGDIVDFAKDVNDNYVGILDENNNYVVITDENGKILLPLKDGKYMTIEVGYPEGYIEKDVTEYFIVDSGRSNVEQDDGKDEEPVTPEEPIESIESIEIYTIEDLIDVKENVSNGETYRGKSLKLMNDLDFNDDSSYRNPSSLEYGDLNKDKKIESIKTELTKVGSIGFSPIGDKERPFKGNFDGNGHEIKNLYINVSNENRYIGLFGYVNGSEFKNVTVSGNFEGRLQSSYVGGLVGYIEKGNVEFVNSNINFDITLENYFETNIGGIVGYINGNITNAVNNCGIKVTSNIVKNDSDVGDVKCNYAIGGIVGKGKNGIYSRLTNKGNIILVNNSNVTVLLSVTNYIAGIIGTGNKVYIYESSNEGNVNVNSESEVTKYEDLEYNVDVYSKNNVAGIAGKVDEIYNSNNNGEILSSIENYPNDGGTFGKVKQANINNVAGIAVYSNRIERSYNLANIIGKIINNNSNIDSNTYEIIGENNVAGIANHSSVVMGAYNKGNIGAEATNLHEYINNESGISTFASLVHYSYNLGNVLSNISNIITSCTNYMGGISSCSDVNCSYSTGNVINNNTSSSTKKDEFIDGISGSGQVSNSYYKEGIELSSGTVPKENVDVTKEETYMKTIDFINDLKDYFVLDSDSINNGYPTLGDSKIERIKEINTIEDLIRLSNQVKDGVDYRGFEVKLVKSLDFKDENSYIDANSTEFGDVNEDGIISGLMEELTTESGFSPIGTEEVPFEGIFNGEGYELNNIYINRTSNYVALFGYIKYGSVKDLTVSGEVHYKKIDQSYDRAKGIAGLIAYIENGKEITNCVSNVNLDEANCEVLAGIVAIVSSCEDINGCINNGVLNSGNSVGGIVGIIHDYGDASYKKNNITNCINNGNITNGSYCGGIIGDGTYSFGSELYSQTEVYIENCNNYGNIKGYTVGGISGKMGANYNIINCKNTADISGSNTGGLIGLIDTALNNKIDSCSNLGNIESSDYAGGLIGYTYSSGETVNIENSENRGNIVYNGYSKVYCAGIIGQSMVCLNIVNTNNYGTANSGIVDYLSISSRKDDNVLTLINCNNYAEKIEKDRASEIGGLCGRIYAYYGKVVVKNCNNHSKLIIKSGDYVGGLFGIITEADLTVENCNNFKDVELYSGSYIGGLFGSLDSCTVVNLSNLNNYGKINGMDSRYAGGISGEIYLRGISDSVANSFTNLHNFGEIVNSGGNYVGGIVGYLSGLDGNVAIDKCYNKGDISVKTSSVKIGGIIGQENCDVYVTETYNIGNINVNSGTATTGGIIGIVANNLKSGKNIYNSGNIDVKCNSTSYENRIAGLFGHLYSNDGKIEYAYNSGNITAFNAESVGGIAGWVHACNLSVVYNKGDISNTTYCSYPYMGGIVGFFESGDMESAWNNGNIIVNAYSGMHFGGIAGYCSNSNIKNVYQAGNIVNSAIGENVSVGGILGYCSGIKCFENAYLLGDFNSSAKGHYVNYGKIVGENSDQIESMSNLYYSKDSNIDFEDSISITRPDDVINGEQLDDISNVKFYELDSEEFYNVLNEDGVWYKINGFYPRLKGAIANVSPSTDLEIKNTIKTFGITTAIMTTNNIKGGAVSGENENPYETVRYGENNAKEIVITPDEGYGISKVTVNGASILFETDDSGIFKIPVGYFSDIKENINVIVKFDKLDSIVNINKVDKDDNSKNLAGAEFKIEQIDERAEVSDEIGNLVDNGKEYVLPDENNKISDVLSDNLTKNGSYYFTKSGDKYISNNKGISKSTANSYIEIDLTDKIGEYCVVVNAEISSESTWSSKDYGYATITKNTVAPSATTTAGRFIYVAGKIGATEYRSDVLQGGSKYYLHLGYTKDARGNAGDDQFTINSINVYGTISTSYAFEENNGRYLANTECKKGTQCNSYIPIDLTNTIGKYTLTVNAESSIIYNTNAYSYGYVTITESEVAPSYSDYNGRLVYINDSYPAKNYNKVLDAGKKYYLHFGYYKGSEQPDETSRFIINSVDLSLNTDDFYEGDTFITNESGKIKLALPNEGTYIITETKAPKGYILNDDPIRIVVSNGNDNSLTIENEKEKSVTVHHYLKDQEGNYTTVKVADDEVIEKTSDDMEYETFAKHDLKNLDLAKDDNGNYVVPDNASGIIGNENIEVNYYYEVQPIKLTVHHYLENSETKLAEDEEKEFEPVVEIEDDRVKSISVDQKYNVSTDEVYNELLQKYELSLIVHDDKIVDTSLLKVANQMLMAIDLNTGDVEDRANVISFTNNSELTYYYSSNDEYTYKVEYYYNNEIDKAKTETGVGKFDDVIDTYTDKAGENYTLDRVENLPLLISEDENSNVVKVYYVLKETSKELNYSVEFYVENELQDEDTIEKKVAVEINEPDTIPVEEMELKGKYKGYKVSKIFKDSEEVSVIPTEVESGSVIKVYYTVDEENTKDLSYIVEYYKDDVLQREDTQIVVNTVQILHDNMIEVDKDSINLVDKYPVSKLSSIEKDLVKIDEIPDKVESGSVIRIFYVYDVTKEKRSYTVNYLEKDTNKVLHEAKVVENNRYEDRILSSNEVIDIYGYEYNSVDKDELIIGLNDEENVINVYYTKKDAKVVVSYYEEGTTNKIVDDVEITGKVNDAYKTNPITDIPNKYELVGTPENAEGIMTEDTIYVAYYYRIKDTKLTVKFINKATGEYMYRADGTQETAITSTGKVGSNYSTEPKDYEGFTLVGSTENTSGILTVEPIEVIYYYLQNTRARVQHIDKITGNVMSEESKEGLVGDEFVTSSKDFEGYILVEEPKNKTIIMTETETILKYYYVHVSEGIIEKHVDVITGKILENKVITGNEGDEYEVLPKTFKDYDLVEDRLPTNSKGTMTVGAIEVTYYYVHKAEVVTKYINKATNEKMTENVVQEGHEGDLYTTENKVFDGYKLVEIPENATGTMKAGRIEVTYYYVVNSVTITENHYDINTMEKIAEERRYEGMVGDSYKTSPVEIEGYDLVKEKYPENAEGIIADKPISVDYYYVKKSSVIVKYLDKISGKEVADTIIIEGHEGDEYTTSDKKIVGYKLSGNTENTTGKIGHDTIIVEYYYVRPAKVIVNYIEQATGKELSEKVEMNGYDGEDYVTEAKEIKYYNLVKEPENKVGKYAINVVIDEDGKEIVDDTIIVNYYYEKKNFNLTIDKNINSIIVNGKEQVVNGKLGKVEVYRKELGTAKIQVVYTISVKNIGELAGKATIMENIPRGMKMLSKDNAGWKIENSEATYETGMIEPGKTQDIKVVFVWESAESNIGTIQNIAQIIGTESESGFAQSDEKDDADGADVIVAISTGDSSYAVTMGLILTVLSAGALVVAKKVKE